MRWPIITATWVWGCHGWSRVTTEKRRLFAVHHLLWSYFFMTLPGYFSWRNSTKGSWFVQALNKVLKDHSHDRDLMWMMTRVNNIVAYEFESNASKEYMNRKKQISSITSQLTKDVYFRPKHWNWRWDRVDLRWLVLGWDSIGLCWLVLECTWCASPHLQ